MEFSKEEVSEIRYKVHLKTTSRYFPGDPAVKNHPPVPGLRVRPWSGS